MGPRIAFQTQARKDEDQEHPALGASISSVVIGGPDDRDEPTGGSPDARDSWGDAYVISPSVEETANTRGKETEPAESSRGRYRYTRDIYSLSLCTRHRDSPWERIVLGRKRGRRIVWPSPGHYRGLQGIHRCGKQDRTPSLTCGYTGKSEQHVVGSTPCEPW